MAYRWTILGGGAPWLPRKRVCFDSGQYTACLFCWDCLGQLQVARFYMKALPFHHEPHACDKVSSS